MTPRERKKQRRKTEKRQRGVRAATKGGAWLKAVKPFDKTTYRHPTGKISTAFMEYANHVIDFENTLFPLPEDANRTLKLCQVVWNQVVLDTTEGGVKHICKLLAVAAHKDLCEMINFLVLVKRSKFGNDQRLIEFFECIPEEGGFCLRVAAGHPPALEPLPEN